MAVVLLTTIGATSGKLPRFTDFTAAVAPLIGVRRTEQ
jgi:hypothetical protein